MGDLNLRGVSLVLTVLLFSMAFASAGVGIRWERESALIPEHTEVCLTYQVYNPWTKDVYAQVKLSDELNNITKEQYSSTEFIPAQTSSSEAIPVEFCFKTPRVYERDCLVAGTLICEQTCSEDMKVYEGSVEVIELTESQVMGGGSGGSATQMSVSAPLRVRVQCIPHDRDWSIVYVLIVLIAGVWLTLNILNSKKKKVKKKRK